MRIVIVGAGGVGGYLGVRLAEAGHTVGWLVRGATAEALRSQGITLQSPQGEVRLGPQIAGDDAAELASQLGAAPGQGADALIVTVKLYDLPQLAPRLAPLAGPDTAILPLQNGVDSHALLAHALPGTAPLKGVVSIKSSRVGPGRIFAKSPFCRIKMGEADNARSPRIEALAAALNLGLGVEAKIAADIDAEVWLKYFMLASFSAVQCLSRATIGQVLDDEHALALVHDAAAEVAAVGRAEGVRVPDDIPTTVRVQVKDMPRDGRSSMLEDLEAGRALELDYLSGTVVRLGRRHGIPTPVHEAAFRALAMHRNGRAK